MLANTDALMVPMFESPFTEQDIAAIKQLRIISPNLACQKHLRDHFGISTDMLRLPIDLSKYEFRQRDRARVFLHNAGSLGQELRKGTDYAVRAWQKSGLGKYGFVLHVHAFLPPPLGLQNLIERDPAGIAWDRTFESSVNAIYETADVLLCCSRAEGDSMVLPEAMAHGLPCIYPDYQPVNEVTLGAPWAVPVANTTPIPWYARGTHHHIDIDELAATLQSVATLDLQEESILAREMVAQHHDLALLRKRWEGAILA
jgi:glycosyltransferase involved in cell wall biosynthesis